MKKNCKINSLGLYLFNFSLTMYSSNFVILQFCNHNPSIFDLLKNIYYIFRLFRINPKLAISKLITKLSAGKRTRRNFNFDSEHQTYSVFKDFQFKKMISFVSLPNLELLEQNRAELLTFTENILKHEFKILNNKPISVNVEYVIHERNNWLKSNISSSNLLNSQIINNLIKNHDYCFIDWQKDFKSNYRWNANQWSKHIIYGNVLNADIKVPWEIGRLQHLPSLAIAYHLIKDENETISSKLADEFQSEFIDFASSNPPRFGTQWMTSMDVGFRAVNLLISKELFELSDFQFSNEFNEHFQKSIYEHGHHIINNLEWSDGMRGNHYLANIASIIFISAYLPATDETNKWMLFGIQELVNEVCYQFNADGSNFEASIPYHFLSSEIVFYSFLIVLSLNQVKLRSLINIEISFEIGKRQVNPLSNLSSEIFLNESGKLMLGNNLKRRLKAIGDFSKANVKSNGNIDLVGDDDSGRFIKFLPPKLELKDLMFDNYNITGINLFELLMKYIKGDIADKIPINSIIHNDNVLLDLETTKKAKTQSFENFGLYIHNDNNYRLSVRCGSVGQKGKGGHSHNDQLSVCLDVAGKEVFVDSGTYCYTSDAVLRNKFRGTASHNTLQINAMEQNDWFEDDKDDLFWLKNDKAKGKKIVFDDKIFVGEHYGFGKTHRRTLKFSENCNGGTDTCEHEGMKNVLFHLHPSIKYSIINDSEIKLFFEGFIINFQSDSNKIEIFQSLHSQEYGVLLHNNVIRISSFANTINWRIDIEDVTI